MKHPICRVILYVSDMKAMASFYSRLINGREIDQCNIDYYWTEICTSGIALALHSGEGVKIQEAQTLKLCFHASSSKDLVTSTENLGARFLSSRSPIETVEVFDFLDPEGNEFSIEVF
ncbi:VOC family protein [Pseudomonas putida]|uniref:VOC family protein n=1 Tax=Pseudomonas putida TaxID=303 RepID=UPI001EF82CA5|nr:VOC family protein [Pseudomonas putida]ULL06146.1 VOC family protein [Pseudomonas putida]